MTQPEKLNQKLLIIGAGDLGQAIAELLLYMGRYKSIAFLDDHPDDTKQEQIPVIGQIDDIETLRDDFTHAIVAIGHNAIRQELRKRIKEAGYAEPTIIHPSAVISPTATIGAGSIVRERVVLSRKVRVGEGVILNIGVSIDHNCVIGNNTHLPMGTIVRNNVSVSELSTFQPGEIIQ